MRTRKEIPEDLRIVCHPPADTKYRANNTHHDSVFPCKNYFDRNRFIVDTCDGIIAVPREMDRQPRGGTWYTFDYAMKKKKWVYLVLPDGTEKVFNRAITEVDS